MSLNRSLLIAALVGLLGVIFALSPLRHPTEHAGLRWLFLMRGSVPPPESIVIVTADGQSGVELGQGNDPERWSRDLHAALLETLTKSGAALVVMDLFFDRPQSLKSDRSFADAIDRAGNVLLVQRLQRFAMGDYVINPIPELSAGVAALAPFPLPKIPDVVSLYWPYYRVMQQPSDTATICHFGLPGRDTATPARPLSKPRVLDVVDAATLPVAALQLFTLRTVGQRKFAQWAIDSGLSHQLAPPQKVDSAAGFCRLFDGLRSELRGRARPTMPTLLSAREPDENALLSVLASVLSTNDPIYLNFYGPPMTFRTLRYSELLASEETDESGGREGLRNAVVFVGHIDFSAIDQKDGFRTVFTSRDGLDIAGVEIAATAFANLIENRYLKTLQPGTQLIMVFLFGAIIGLLGAYVSGYWGVGVVLLVSTSYVFAVIWQFETYSRWLPLFTPIAVQLPLALLVTQFSKYLISRRQSTQYKKSLGQYLPHRAARALGVDHITTRKTELVYGVCMLTDVQDYTLLSESLSPTELAGLMNEYFALLEGDAERNRGDVLRIEGDSLAAVWVADDRQQDVRLLAGLAALEMSRSVGEFNRRHASTPFITRIGILDGEIAIGDIGGAGRYTYNVTGDVMNTASRIEGLNKVLGTTILCGESTITGIDELVVRRIARFLLKGKAKPQTVYQLVGRKGEVAEEVLELLDRFGEANQCFEKGDITHAGHLYQVLSEEFPDDGPSRFFADYCHSLPARHVHTPVIRVDAK